MKASDGYFLAKRQVQESLDGRISILKKSLDKLQEEGGQTTGITLILIEIEILEKTRNHFRNSLLWDASLDKVKE